MPYLDNLVLELKKTIVMFGISALEFVKQEKFVKE